MYQLTKAHLLGGHLTFTVTSGRTGRHETFRITRADEDGPRGQRYFVNVHRADGEKSWSYVGMLDPNTLALIFTKKSRYVRDAQIPRVFEWAVGMIVTGEALAEGYAIEPEGTCARCGRALTDSASISRGWGPDCFKLIAEAA